LGSGGGGSKGGGPGGAEAEAEVTVVAATLLLEFVIRPIGSGRTAVVAALAEEEAVEDVAAAGTNAVGTEIGTVAT